MVRPGPIPLGSYAFDGNPCKATDTGYPCKGEFTGTPVPHPGWNGALTVPNTHDMGVVQLTQAPNKGLSKIAPLGYLDNLATKRGQQNVNFTVVGYGVQFERPNLEIAIKQRFVGTNQLQNLRSHIAGGYNLMMTDSNGGGTGRRRNLLRRFRRPDLPHRYGRQRVGRRGDLVRDEVLQRHVGCVPA